MVMVVVMSRRCSIRRRLNGRSNLEGAERSGGPWPSRTWLFFGLAVMVVMPKCCQSVNCRAFMEIPTNEDGGDGEAQDVTA